MSVFDYRFNKPFDVMDEADVRIHAMPSRPNISAYGPVSLKCRVCGKDDRGHVAATPLKCDPKWVMRFIAGHKKYSLIFTDVSLIMRDHLTGAPESMSASRLANVDYFRSIVALHEAGIKVVRVADEIWVPQHLYELANVSNVKPVDLFWEIARQLKTGERQVG